MSEDATKVDEQIKIKLSSPESIDCPERSSAPEPVAGARAELSAASGTSLVSDQKAIVDLGDQYEVIEAIGQGAMGQVYKVRDRQLDRILAIKLLNKNLAADMQAVKRFAQEAAAAANLSHPNLVTVYGYGQARDGSPFLIMNFIEGESLASILRRQGALDPKRAVNIFYQVAEGLDYAHSQGLIHRDLKPSNIIISSTESGAEEVAHIVDFGIAKVASGHGDTLSTLTTTGDFIGTPAYMSPEQCLGQTIDQRTDIYAFGCLLYEALTGQAPFASATSVEVIAKKITEDAAPLSSSQIPQSLDMIVTCCTARNAANRYENSRRLREDLISVAQDMPPRYAASKIRPDGMVFLKRFAAFAIDYTIVSTVAGLLMFVFMIVGMLFYAALSAAFHDFADSISATVGILFILSYLSPGFILFLYYVWFEAKRGHTFGKQILGLRVRDQKGAPPSLLRAAQRNGGKLLFLGLIPGLVLFLFLIPNVPIACLAVFLSYLIIFALYLRTVIVHRQFPWDVLSKCEIVRR